ncbi:hypothetical protein VCHC57A1_2332, partial [Vibrio cholerae HC-57A1]
MTAGTPIINTS